MNYSANKFEDFYWLNHDSRKFLSEGEGYLREGVDPEVRLREISDNAEKILGIEGFSDKFFGYLAKGFYSLSTPVWTNFGNDRGWPVACYGSFLSDTIDSILDKSSEVGKMSKNGGGTSGYFGELRPRGTKISGGGESSGPVHFMEIYDKVTSVISQGSSRRGSFVAYLPVEHPDIEEFLKIRSEGSPIQEMSIGVTITDEWMNKMMEGDKDKRKIWGQIIKKKFETGYPYIFFTDTVNNNAPQVYKDKGKKINASNLCVAPETELLTKNGVFQIKSLEGKEVEVWNGECWSETKVIKTGENQKLIHIWFEKEELDYDELNDLWVTEYHKFYLSDGTEVAAKDLKDGDILETFVDPLRVYREDDGKRTFKVSLTTEYRFDDTYCVNEPLRHKAVFNGVLTGNCSEIALSSDEENSFVCVLSSLNLLHWDKIKETDAVETLIYFLDAVNEEFVRKTDGVKFMETAHNFAKTQRALGAGVLGWHSLLQSKMISFESLEAKLLNNEIFKFIKEKSDKATKELAEKFGEPELLKGYGIRNVTTMAIAPTASSSFLLGQVSPSIEPLLSNYYVKRLAKGSFPYKNPYLKELLKEKGQNNDEVWKSILTNNGSVQHLDFLSDEEKEVFKTFAEVNQMDIIIQASQRQKYIDQSQSLNIMIPSNVKPKLVSELLIEGWKLGIKTFYYQRSSSPSADLVKSLTQCSSCES